MAERICPFSHNSIREVRALMLGDQVHHMASVPVHQKWSVLLRLELGIDTVDDISYTNLGKPCLFKPLWFSSSTIKNSLANVISKPDLRPGKHGLCCKGGREGWVGYFLFIISYKKASQPWVHMSSCIWKWVDSSYFQVCYASLFFIQFTFLFKSWG